MTRVLPNILAPSYKSIISAVMLIVAMASSVSVGILVFVSVVMGHQAIVPSVLVFALLGVIDFIFCFVLIRAVIQYHMIDVGNKITSFKCPVSMIQTCDIPGHDDLFPPAFTYKPRYSINEVREIGYSIRQHQEEDGKDESSA